MTDKKLIDEEELAENNQKYLKLAGKNLPIDHAIYNHFSEKFELEIAKRFGTQEEIDQEVELLKNLTREKYEKTCQVTEIIPEMNNGDFSLEQIKKFEIPEDRIPWHPKDTVITTLVPKNKTSDECRLLTMPEGQFAFYLKMYQKLEYWRYGLKNLDLSEEDVERYELNPLV